MEGHPSTWSDRATTIVRGVDLWIGVGVGVSAGLAAGFGKHVLDSAEVVLTTEVLLGAGLLAVVLAALAILTTFFDEKYREALRQGPGGFQSVVFPFKIVGFAGAASAVGGLIAITLWTAFPHWLQALAFGLVSGMSAWAIAGTWQLVSDTTFHGIRRAELLELDRITRLFQGDD